MIIFGASGHGKVVYDILDCQGRHVSFFLDDNPKGNVFCGVPLCLRTEFSSVSEEELVIAVGNNRIREKISLELKNKYRFGVACHPTSTIAKDVNIGEGTVIMAKVVVNSSSRIGKHCILNTSSVIDHDCELGDFVHISPNASIAGSVRIGKGTQIGIGSCVIQGVNIGENVMVGAGAVIINDIPDNAVVVGNPGRVIKYK